MASDHEKPIKCFTVENGRRYSDMKENPNLARKCLLGNLKET